MGAPKYTKQQRDFVINYPDYPSWVIQEALKDKCGKTMSTAYIRQLRGYGGTKKIKGGYKKTNKHLGRGKRSGYGEDVWKTDIGDYHPEDFLEFEPEGFNR